MKREHFKLILPLCTIALLVFLNFFTDVELASVFGISLVFIFLYSGITMSIGKYFSEIGVAISMGIVILLMILTHL